VVKSASFATVVEVVASCCVVEVVLCAVKVVLCPVIAVSLLSKWSRAGRSLRDTSECGWKVTSRCTVDYGAQAS